MNQPEDNVSRLREAYRLWGETRGDSVSVWLDMMWDDVRMISLADGGSGMEFTRPHQGKSQAINYFQELNAAWEMLSFDAHEFIAQNDRVVMLGRCSFRSRATGKSAESPKVDIFRFKDGKIIEYQEFYDTAKAFAAATP